MWQTNKYIKHLFIHSVALSFLSTQYEKRSLSFNSRLSWKLLATLFSTISPDTYVPSLIKTHYDYVPLFLPFLLLIHTIYAKQFRRSLYYEHFSNDYDSTACVLFAKICFFNLERPEELPGVSFHEPSYLRSVNRFSLPLFVRMTTIISHYNRGVNSFGNGGRNSNETGHCGKTNTTMI